MFKKLLKKGQLYVHALIIIAFDHWNRVSKSLLLWYYFLHNCTFFRQINLTKFSWKWFHGKLALFWTLEVWREATRVLSRETKIKRALKRSSHIILSSSKFGLVTIPLSLSLSCINFFVRKRLNDFHPFWHDIFRSYKFDAEKLTRESILSFPGISHMYFFSFSFKSQRKISK